MRPLAEFIMRGRTQATLVVVLGAVVPLLYWMTAAGGSLVLLRRGPAAAAGVLVWALLPALFWLYLGDASIVLVLLGSTLLAAILRQSLSWTRVLLASVPLGLVFALVLGQVYAEGIAQLAEEIRRLLPQVLGPSAAQLPPEKQAQLQQLLLPVLTGLMAAFFQITCLLCLMLGRYWQAALYNPQGFGREFRVLRLRPAIALGLLALLVLAPNLGSGLGLLTPMCSVPLAFAGIALLHGLVAAKRLAGFWLVGLYVTLLLFGQLIYPLLVILAVIDSVFDFRGRSAQEPQGPADGEG